MINKIVMKNVASYKAETILQTDKKINLIYGLNGTGKSTVSGFLYDMTEPAYADCSVEGLMATDRVLVYNQKFVRDHFHEKAGIQGIFTLSKENKEAQQLIEKATKAIKEYIEKRKAIEIEKEKKEKEYKKQVSVFQKETWVIKSEFSGEDKTLEFCLAGVRRSQEDLFNHLVAHGVSEDQIDYSIEDLKKEVQDVKGDAQKEEFLRKVSFRLERVELSPLLTKIIVGNRDSSVAALIERLGNSDWVNEGLQYVHDEENGLCPFCQSRTINQELLTQIRGYFDESYKKDKAELESLLQLYVSRTQEYIAQIEAIKSNRFLAEALPQLEASLAKMTNTIFENTSLLQEKVKTPSAVISLIPLAQYEKQLNGIIDEANKKIEAYNKKIDDVQGVMDGVKERFWRLMGKRFESLLNLYKKGQSTHMSDMEQCRNQITQIDDEIAKQKATIEENRKRTVNIDGAVDNIKKVLVDIGITDFTIEKYSDEEALYCLRRGDGQDAMFETLSEGEKMVISFLYFMERCKGEQDAASVSTSKIVVIDDPISSLSHIHVFNIGRLIHKEFLRTKKYEQVFVLTHSLYFFYELTNINHKEREETQRLFRICKNSTGSYFENMSYEEIQNDYQAYWQIVKDKDQEPALIANCMRNIIEYFFNFVEKLDLNNVFQKPEMQEISCQAFNRYMNRESHSKGQNIFDIKEFDYDSFRAAFQKVFELTGYEEHYKRMMK